MAKKKSAIHETRLAFLVILARTFSSKINAANVSSRKPMDIDQNVIDPLDKNFEVFLVAMMETAKLVAEAKVKRLPRIKS